MGPSLRVSTGTSLDQLQVVPVNYDKTGVIELDSELFHGRIAVRLRDFAGELPEGKQRLKSCESDYFEDHADLTWSMTIQGEYGEFEHRCCEMAEQVFQVASSQMSTQTTSSLASTFEKVMRRSHIWNV